MKKRLGILAIFCTLVIGLTTTTIVSADFNLEWGFEVGDQFHFRISGTPLMPVVDYYVEIDSIPFNFTEGDFEDYNLGLIYYTTYYENGTEMPYPQAFFALPIGNWSVIQDTWNETFLDFTLTSINTLEWINTQSEWGFIATADLSSVLTTITMKFSKLDGVLNIMRTVMDPEVGLTVTAQIARRNPQANVLLSTPVIVGLGVGIVALVIVGAAIKYR